jgi:putative FmdB family regulatory protein
MPTYEYECTSCGQHIEVFQRITEDPLTTCGACGGALRKVFHPAGIVFKGSGFYATDNRSSPKTESKTEPKKEPKKDAGSTGSSSSSTSSSSDGGSTSSTPKESASS